MGSASKDKIVQPVWDAIKGIIRGAVNGIISGIEGFLNAAIKGFNLLARAVNAVASFFHVSARVDMMPEVHIQRVELERGGTIPPAMVGDGGPDDVAEFLKNLERLTDG